AHLGLSRVIFKDSRSDLKEHDQKGKWKQEHTCIEDQSASLRPVRHSELLPEPPWQKRSQERSTTRMRHCAPPSPRKLHTPERLELARHKDLSAHVHQAALGTGRLKWTCLGPS